MYRNRQKSPLANVKRHIKSLTRTMATKNLKARVKDQIKLRILQNSYLPENQVTEQIQTDTQIQARILQNSQIPMNQLPIEIFVKIISFTARPSIYGPYPYVGLESVCKCWRSAILGHSVFWKIIVLGWGGLSPTGLEEVIRRSGSVALDIIVEDMKPSDVYALVTHRFPSVASRVKTLHLNIDSDPSSSDLMDLISVLPSLKNIFFRFPRSVNELDFLPPCIQPQLQAMQIYIKRLGNLAIPGHFRELRWLSLTYESSLIPLLSLQETLENLPRLQYLYLSLKPPHHRLETEIKSLKTVITLPALRVLISNCPILHIIDAPNLSYIDVFAMHSSVEDAYDRLCGFDFSKITHIRSEVQATPLHGRPCIIGRQADKCDSKRTRRGSFDNDRCCYNNVDWESFDAHLYNSSIERIFNESPTMSCCPKRFCLSFASQRGRSPDIIPTLSLYLKKSHNLVEIVLKRLDLSFLVDPSEIDSFSNSLRSATAVRSLTILSSKSFKTICDLLGDGDLLPRLGRLSFTVDDDYPEEEEVPSPVILSSLQKIKKRSLSHPIILEIELRGFGHIRSRELQEIEQIGLLKKVEKLGDCVNYFIYF